MKLLAKFGLVGIFNTLITICSYSLLVMLGINYIIANIIGYVLGVINSFYWNKNWVFKSKSNHMFLKFVFVNVITLIINNLFLFLLVSKCNLNEYFSQIFSTGIGLVINFMLNKNWTFVKTHKNNY